MPYVSYGYVRTYLIPFFFTSLYAYRTAEQLPRWVAFRLKWQVLYLRDRYTFLKTLFLLSCFVQAHPVAFQRLRYTKGANWQFCFVLYGSGMLRFWESFMLGLLAKNVKNPFPARGQEGRFLSYSLRSWRQTFESGHLELQLYELMFYGHVGWHFCFSQSPRRLAEKLNYVRMVNFPLFRKK